MCVDKQSSGKTQAGNSAWDDFNRRRNAAIRNQGFTTKESARGPVHGGGLATGGGGQVSALSQDATNAYLQSIGVSAGAVSSAPQYAPIQPQYATAQPGALRYAPAQQYVAAPPTQAQQVAYVPMMQPPVQYVSEPYMPAQSMPPAQQNNMVPVQYEVKHSSLFLLPFQMTGDW